MIEVFFVFVIAIVWLGYELYRAPLVDEDGNIIHDRDDQRSS